MGPKSIYRQPGALHFQLVHRSQRDPLVHDPSASQHVLKPFERENALKKGKSRAELEALLSPSELAQQTSRPNIGEATNYGVYYDDSEYDYMQHLRSVDDKDPTVESILIPGPSTSSRAHKQLDLRLPSEALPSRNEISASSVYEAQKAVPDAIRGLQPDMNPHLRQALEALDEDAFVDEQVNDDFFEELMEGGEREQHEEFEFEFREEGIEDDQEDESSPDADTWEARFARFKKQDRSGMGPGDSGEESDGGDTIGHLPVIGGKRRRKGAATASSGLSMTSSAMARNAAQRAIDERFDHLEKQYDSDEDEMPEDDAADGSDDEAPDLIDARDDMDAILTDFLDNFELVGNKVKPALKGRTPAEKLDTIRRALGSARLTEGEEEHAPIPMPDDVDVEKERWDCETILSTYTNLENHPRLIRVRESHPTPKIQLDPKSGLPTSQSGRPALTSRARKHISDDDSDQTESASRTTIVRPRDESKEDKKARKQVAKEERQARRISKKATQKRFAAERDHQLKISSTRSQGVVRAL